MILTCTVCQTTYYAEPSTIGADGRQVKCASCGHTWHVDASGIEAQPKAQATSAAHTSYLRTVHERHVKRSRAAALAAWAVVGAAAVTIVAAGLVNRHAVVDRWPQAASAYGLVGLTVNRFGVEFENVERRRDIIGTTPVLTVAADVRNTGTRPRPAPRVTIGLLDPFGKRIAEFEAAVEPGVLAPGTVGRFRAVMENPPADSYTLDLRFAPADRAPGKAQAGLEGKADMQ
ncbi:MAG: MJ0042-type zinc finger domain-containing protein [Pseudomonadota bacterium]